MFFFCLYHLTADYPIVVLVEVYGSFSLEQNVVPFNVIYYNVLLLLPNDSHLTGRKCFLSHSRVRKAFFFADCLALFSTKWYT